MLLSEIKSSTTVTQISGFTDSSADRLRWVDKTVAVKFVGFDGRGNHLLLGKWEGPYGDGSDDIAMVVLPDGAILGINTTAPKEAVDRAIEIKQRAYGPSSRPAHNWSTSVWGLRLKTYHGPRMEGTWVVKSPDGVPGRFKDREAADQWQRGTHPKLSQLKTLSVKDYLDRAEKERSAKPSDSDIWQKFQQAVGDSFPDGDPMDRMSGWMRQHGLTMLDLDAAVKSYEGVGAYEYLSKMWDDRAADEEHDAMQGHLGPTYGDEWFTRPNPWK